MNIEVLYFGKPRELAGTSNEIIALKEGARLRDLIEMLKNKYGAEFGREIEGLRILVNGREYELVGGMDAPLQDKDTVVFLPMIFGG